MIKDLIETCFENNIMINWINSSDIMVIKNKKKISFKFSKFSSVEPLDTLDKRKEETYKDLDWLKSEKEGNTDDHLVFRFSSNENNEDMTVRISCSNAQILVEPLMIK